MISEAKRQEVPLPELDNDKLYNSCGKNAALVNPWRGGGSGSRLGQKPSGWKSFIGVAAIAGVVAAVGTVLAFGQDLGLDEPISPIPREIILDHRKVDLGRRLFTDSRLSGDNGMSCASCHILERGLADGMAISRGLRSHPGLTNTPTLFNVGLSSKFSWSGHFLTLEEQAASLIENERVMGGKWEQIVPTLKSDTALVSVFGQIYADGISRDNIINAIVEFEKSLITPDAPFDRYLRGDKGAISKEATAGYELFKTYGCASCHQGVNVGGNMLQVFGIFGTPDAASFGADTPGASMGTGISEDKPVFRVPSLRNVEKTAPYFHDGSAKTLSAAINIMAAYQLGRDLSQDDVAKIEAFLNSLTGEYQGVPVGDHR